LVGLRNFGAAGAELAVAVGGMFKVFKAWSAGSVGVTAVEALKLLGYSK
jgi:hypothetical protein